MSSPEAASLPFALHRRTLLRGLFLGLGVAAVPGFIRQAQAAGGGT